MAEDTKKRDRSPNFPFIGIESALTRARQLYDQEKRGVAALSVVAKHWNYSLKSSAFLQTIGALKSYGLLDDEGRGLDRRVKLSDVALRVLLDPRQDSPERSQLVRQAILNPGIAQAILERFPDDLPSESNLEHFLIFECKFSPEAAKSAVKIFFENNAFCGYYNRDKSNISQPEDDSIEGGVEVSRAAIAPKAMIPAAQPLTGVTTIERIGGPEGPITLQFVTPPSWETFDFLEHYVKLRKSVLKRGQVDGSNEVDEK